MNLDLVFLLTTFFLHLKLTHHHATVSRCLHTCRRLARALPHFVSHGNNSPMLVSTQCWLLLAAACCSKTVKVLGSCDCGGMVTLGVEAVLIRGVVDRSVLTADFDPGVGLITCESVVFGQRIKQQPSARSSACGLPDSRLQW